MKRVVAILTLVFAVVLSAQAQSKVKEFSVKSKILGVEKKYSVYLPDGYEKSGENYPVLYLLHGAKGTHFSWLEKERGNMQEIVDAEIASGRCKKMIIVLPNASGEGEKNAGKIWDISTSRIGIIWTSSSRSSYLISIRNSER